MENPPYFSYCYNLGTVVFKEYSLWLFPKDILYSFTDILITCRNLSNEQIAAVRQRLRKLLLSSTYNLIKYQNPSNEQMISVGK